MEPEARPETFKGWGSLLAPSPSPRTPADPNPAQGQRLSSCVTDEQDSVSRGAELASRQDGRCAAHFAFYVNMVIITRKKRPPQKEGRAIILSLWQKSLLLSLRSQLRLATGLRHLGLPSSGAQPRGRELSLSGLSMVSGPCLGLCVATGAEGGQSDLTENVQASLSVFPPESPEPGSLAKLQLRTLATLRVQRETGPGVHSGWNVLC